MSPSPEHRSASAGPAASDECVTLLRTGPPAWLERHVITVAGATTLPYVADTWTGAMAIVECGSVVLEHAAGAELHLDEGAVVCLAGLDLRAIRNATSTAVMAVARRKQPNTP